MAEERGLQHPLVTAVHPLTDALGATVLPAAERSEGDIPLRWEGELVAVVRLPAAAATTGLAALIGEVERELGGPLRELSRRDKQRAVRLLEERGAFEWRRAVETIAEAIGVTRFTVYNYLNRDRTRG
jgi:hypothetical protein